MSLAFSLICYSWCPIQGNHFWQISSQSKIGNSLSILHCLWMTKWNGILNDAKCCMDGPSSILSVILHVHTHVPMESSSKDICIPLLSSLEPCISSFTDLHNMPILSSWPNRCFHLQHQFSVPCKNWKPPITSKASSDSIDVMMMTSWLHEAFSCTNSMPSGNFAESFAESSVLCWKFCWKFFAENFAGSFAENQCFCWKFCWKLMYRQEFCWKLL